VISHEAGMIIGVQLFGGRLPNILYGKKRPKFGAISDNFRLRSRIYPERSRYRQAENGVVNYNFSHVRWKRFGELWSTKHKV